MAKHPVPVVGQDVLVIYKNDREPLAAPGIVTVVRRKLFTVRFTYRSGFSTSKQFRRDTWLWNDEHFPWTYLVTTVEARADASARTKAVATINDFGLLFRHDRARYLSLTTGQLCRIANLLTEIEGEVRNERR